ncbi:GNAT family N-acetyltransferase [Sphaerotilus sp.]|jgi:CelD/BcsL family acetyltransferase involved in cellulose biosynthesis|uniref:GNAT family N-acetyltransferase n=1 Tax=Sphaerotilus sp. TaxID=2093942 RepID=UPI00286DC792|nr:GNAT family N-acetyltransferase [Sphaerotilus sp.]
MNFLPWDTFMQRHEAAWLRLWTAVGAAPDLSPIWALSLIHGHRLNTAELQVAFQTDVCGELLLVWPLRFTTHRRMGLVWKKVGALTNIFCLHGGLLTLLDTSVAVRQTLQALRGMQGAWSWLDVDLLEVGSSLHTAWLRAAQQTGCGVERIPKGRSPYIVSPGTLDEFLATKSRNFRSNMRARRREVMTSPDVEVRYFTQPHEMDAYFALALSVERTSWKRRVGSSLDQREWETRLYDDLMGRYAQIGQVLAAVLFIDGVPTAHSMDVLQGGRVYGLKTSFDPGFTVRRPGVMLLVARLERYFAQGVREFDFIGQDEDYKLQWSRQCRAHESLRLYAPTLAARALFLSTDLRRRWRDYRGRSSAPTPVPVAGNQPALARASLEDDRLSVSA